MSDGLSEEETRALLQMAGFQDYGIPIGTNPNSQLNLFQEIITTMGDPTFLFMQGLMSGQGMMSDVQDLLFDKIDTSEADWWTPYELAQTTGEDILAEGMRLIYENGATVNQVMRALEARFADFAGEISDIDERKIDSIREELEDFEKKYRNAVEIDAKVATGEYIQDRDGNYFKPVDTETGRKRLEDYGLSGYYANPSAWRIQADQTETQRSVALLEEARKLEEERLNKSKAFVKQGSGAEVAQSAYKQFLNQTPAGKQVLEKVSQQRKTDGGISIDPKKAGAVLLAQALGLPAMPFIGAKKAVSAALSSWNRSAPGSRDSEGNFVPPWERKPAAVVKQEEKKAMANQDYWAKLSASYAGRAAQDQKRKELSRLENEAAQKKAASTEAAMSAREKGTSNAMQMMQIAPYVAALAAQSAGRGGRGGGGGGAPAPRVLSDQEIESMATMIAGGFA